MTASTTQTDADPAEAQETRRSELAGFLRSRRERIRPEDVGLRSVGRRRTPGLRREEVAQLSGVGLTWYTWLEQGRDINVSPQVVDAIARTLRLSRHEWSHLSLLAGTSPLAADDGQRCAALTPVVRAAMNGLDPLPVIALNDRYDMLASNRAYRTLITDLEQVPEHERNVLWQVFTGGELSRVVLDLDVVCSRMVATLRSNAARHLGDSSWQRFIEALQAASPDFAELWERHDVAPSLSQAKRFDHPVHGRLSFTTDSLYTRAEGEVRLHVYVAADEHTQSVLDSVD